MGPDVVKKYQATNASLTAVDPKTGEVLAMVGSIDYSTSKSGNTNYADALLQPGSSFKPIVFATAFGPENTYAPGSITYDVPTDFGNYKPNNYDGKFHGAITNRQALAGSLNIPAVKNLELAGLDKSIETAKAMGVTTLNRPPQEYGLSLVLGSGEVRPVEMAGAYATFANNGMHNELRPILTIEKDGQVIKDFTATEAKKALEPEVAYQISNILSDNGARSYVFGTRNNLVLSDRPVAAKSGTTENNRDAWTIGYTPSISVAVWVGNNEANKTMVKGADGSYVAAPIWNRFMKEYLKGKPVEQFERPATIKEMTVDRLSGKIPTDQSPENERVTDIFAPWQIPKGNDDIHVKVRVVKGTNLLATDLTPADMVEERIYFTIKSERPLKPSWEQPVQAWARANYGDRVGSPPTEIDGTYVEANRPNISITSPLEGTSVSGSFILAAAPGGNRAITKVDFYINSVLIGTISSSPWSMTYNAASLPPGSQVIQAVATNDLGLTATAEVTVTTAGQDATPPGNVSNLKRESGTLPTVVRLSWLNPSDSDLDYMNVYESTSEGSLGTLVQRVNGLTPSQTGMADINQSKKGDYYYTLEPVDKNGNRNTSYAAPNKIKVKVL
jgi:membrane peptidoglycan carboxypeptidase